MTYTKIDDGGPVHPCSDASYHTGFSGMSLRAWLAGEAMQGLLGTSPIFNPNWLAKTPSARATHAVAEADALITALKEPKP